MTKNLTNYIEKARLNLHEAWTHEYSLGETEKRELSHFKAFLRSKVDFFVRTELFPLQPGSGVPPVPVFISPFRERPSTS